MNSNRFHLAVAAAMLAAALAAPAQTSTATIGATVRDSSALFNGDFDEVATGYLMVKYGSAQSAGKSYFKFDLTGQSPNTNNAFTLSFTTMSNNGRQHIQVWALNQAYPGMSSAISWATAQANHTNLNSNDMLTNGPYTATPLADFVASSTVGSKSVTLPAPWGSYLAGNELVLVLTGYNDPPTNSANGCRIALGSTQIAYQQLVGAPPSIGPITNLTVMSGQTSADQPFTVTDPEDGPDSLWPTATSSNPAIVDAGSILFGGSGAGRTLSVLGGSPGTANITVSVYDSAGNTAQRTFTVTVLALDYPPTISAPATTNTLFNTPVTVPLTVGDVETPADGLAVSGQIASYSLNVLSNLTFSGSGSNRTVTVEPVPGADGVGVVTVSVMDSNNNISSATFPVMVQPAANVVFVEHFDYVANKKLFDYAAGLWVRRNTNPGDVNLLTAPDGLQGYTRPKTSADDGAARLLGAPYRPGAGNHLYVTFRANWTNTGASDAVVSNSNGGFVHLANNSTASSTLFAKVATTTNNTPDGAFHVALYDLDDQYQASTNVNIPQPVSSSGPYRVVVRYDVDSAKSALWINAASEAEPAALSQDQAAAENVSYIGLRQDIGFGYVEIDDLKVVLAVKPTITSAVVAAGGTVDLHFSSGPGDGPASFGIQRAATLDEAFITGPFNEVSATIIALGNNTFKATVATPGNQGYFRVKRVPMTFP